MTVGCYVIGEDVVHLSLPETERVFEVKEAYIPTFISACTKLPQKLECLVIVDPNGRKPSNLKEYYEIGKKYANSVYIVPAIVAILQYAISTIKHFYFNKILILIRINEKFYACSIMINDGNLQFYPYRIKTEEFTAFGQNFYADFTTVYCINASNFAKQKSVLKAVFPSIKFLEIPSPMQTLAMGGFYKAQCFAEPGKHLEMLNFSLGIFNGSNAVVKQCAKFPLQCEYQLAIGITTTFRDVLIVTKKLVKGKWILKWKTIEFDVLLPAQQTLKNYLFKYSEFGLLTVEERSLPLSFSVFTDFLFKDLNVVHVWSKEKQTRVMFNFAKNERTFYSFYEHAKNLFTDEWLNSATQRTTVAELSTDESTTVASNLHIILVDKKVNNYMNGPRISITPAYIGILQYYVTYFKPAAVNLIIIISTKESSKFYALIKRSDLCYTVTYAAHYDSETFFDSISKITNKIKILYIYETGMDHSVPFKFLSTKISIIRHELTNIDEVAFYENNCDGLSPISLTTSKCFYEIDAFFHGALKSVTDSNLFYGSLIAVLIKRKWNVYIYFFVHVKNKFLFKSDLIEYHSHTIDAGKLHYADIVIIAENVDKPKFADDVTIRSFTWDKITGVNQFLKDMGDEKLLIYDTTRYSEVIANATDNHILEDTIYEKTFMMIEYETNKCRIMTENDECLAIINVVWIPMYISFSQVPLLVGNEAVKDLKKLPNTVIYDFLQLLDVTSSTLSSTFNPKWSFKLVEMDDSEDPKFGYNVTTTDGLKIISPEMALTIYLQKLICVYEKFTGKAVDEICFKVSDTLLTEVQKESFKNAAKRLKKCCIFC